MQLDNRVAVVRIFPLFSHILLTTVLYWTKFDSIQVTLSFPSDKSAYQFADESYTGLISVSLIFLIFQVVCLGLEVRVTLWTILHIFLDICACTFVTWIILDGLSWETYVYIFTFCRWKRKIWFITLTDSGNCLDICTHKFDFTQHSLIPAIYDLSLSMQNAIKRLRTNVKGPLTWH